MKFLPAFICAVFVLLALPTAHAATPRIPPFDLEKKIAYQQGQFAALYDHCGTPNDKALIGGSVDSWRHETFQGYMGTAEERAGIEKEFDTAVIAVNADPNSCQEWVKQAAATWRGIVNLSQGTAPAVGLR